MIYPGFFETNETRREYDAARHRFDDPPAVVAAKLAHVEPYISRTTLEARVGTPKPPQPGQPIKQPPGQPVKPPIPTQPTPPPGAPEPSKPPEHFPDTPEEPEAKAKWRR